MSYAIFTIMIAVVLDIAIGDPRYRWHPVRLIGHAITFIDQQLQKQGLANMAGGVLLLCGSCGLAAAVTSLAYLLVSVIPGASIVFAIYVVYSCLGLGDLRNHAGPIAVSLLRGDLDLARERVVWIVGRDVSQLDSSGVSRAAVESVSENFVDAFLAPLFWFGLITIITGGSLYAGLIAVVVYRTVNTLDAMVGYRNETYIELGCASARCDDVLNFLPARLSVPVIAFAAKLTGNHAQAAMQIGWRDRLKHPSPNSAHSESAMAGALGIALGGPTPYPHGLVAKAWLNEEGQPALPADIQRAVKVITAAAIISAVGLFVSMWLFG